jgi:uncharacterized protein with PQ loop repeat
MVTMNIGRHHQHLRKRVYSNMEEYPHPDKLKNFVDKLVYFAGIVGVLMTLPQIWLIYFGKTAVGLSLISWISYWIIGMIWLFYGIIHKERPIIVLNIMWFFLYLAIIIGIFIYG